MIKIYFLIITTGNILKQQTNIACSTNIFFFIFSVVECKERWENIRNGFVRSLKSPPSESSAMAKKPYYLHDLMQFVLPYVRAVHHSEKTGGNFPIPEETNEDDIIQANEDEPEEQTGQESSEPPKVQEQHLQTPQTPTQGGTKRKLKKGLDEVDKTFLEYLKLQKEVTKTEDHRKMFLLSLLPDVRKLSENNLRTFKIKTMMLLDDILI